MRISDWSSDVCSSDLVGAASLVYFGKDIHELTLGEIATIAGLPKAPSRDNPIANQKRAHDRRDYVLGRMLELGHISDAEYQAAPAATDTVHPYQASELESAAGRTGGCQYGQNLQVAVY